MRGALVAALLGRVVAGAGTDVGDNPLVAPARCVSDYLEAVAEAAPPRPRRAPPPARAASGEEPRWERARSLLASPRGGAAGAALTPPAPWESLGRDGAFLGYELLEVRRAPHGAAVVVAAERTVRTPQAEPVTQACAYLASPGADGGWRVLARRCGEGFSDDEVAAAVAAPP